MSSECEAQSYMRVYPVLWLPRAQFRAERQNNVLMCNVECKVDFSPQISLFAQAVHCPFILGFSFGEGDGLEWAECLSFL